MHRYLAYSYSTTLQVNLQKIAAAQKILSEYCRNYVSECLPAHAKDYKWMKNYPYSMVQATTIDGQRLASGQDGAKMQRLINSLWDFTRRSGVKHYNVFRPA